MAKHPLHLWIPFVALLVIAVGINALILLNRPVVTGQATSSQAEIGLCVNTPPVVNTSDCMANAFIFSNYSCTLSASDTQQTSFSFWVSKLSGPMVGDPLFSYMRNATLNFTPQPGQEGNYTLRFFADDGSGCGGRSYKDFNLTINFSNNAPYLIKPIPNQTWDENVLLVPFHLNDYFGDPNHSPLTYEALNNVNVRVDIDPQANAIGGGAADGEVLLTPAHNWCGNETVVFRAKNNLNLTADSNAVNLSVKCVSNLAPKPPAPTKKGGGAGGGASGSSQPTQSCASDYTCFDWSTCQLTRAINAKTGNSQTIEITSVKGTQTYYIDPAFANDPDVFYQGFQYKQCIDTQQCELTTKFFVRNCTYKPSCSDGIQNQGETGVDCGGSCEPCNTCKDGVQDGLETGVDCGGPECPVCSTCTDGKIDGKETGVDCGGPDCPVCSQVQLPAPTTAPTIPFPWLTAVLLLLILLILGALFYTAINRHIMSLLMKFLFKYKRTNRIIILPTHLKDEIIRRLAELEAKIDKQPMLKSQEELAVITRDYFKEALHMNFEFTNEELVATLSKSHLDPILSKIMQEFFKRISVIEFSGMAVAPIVLRALVQETRSLVYQTSVLTVDDLKEREKDLELNELPKDAPAFDRNYLLLSQAHLCLQFNKLELTAALYTVLHDWYSKASAADQAAIYEDLQRLYNEYVLATSKKA